MSVIKFIVIGLIILAVAYLAGLSFLSRQHRLKVEGERQLSPCSDKPNCVSSLATDEKHTILPLSLVDTDPDLGWNKLMAAIQQNKGEILITTVAMRMPYLLPDCFVLKMTWKPV